MKKNILGKRIQQARKSSKPPITQLDLVARLQALGLSIDQSGLSKMENGQRPITDIEIIGFSRSLKVSISWLFDDAEIMGQHSEGRQS